MFHNPFRDMKAPTSNSSRCLLRSFLVTLLSSPSIFHPLAFLTEPSPLEVLRYRFTIFPFSFVFFQSGLHRFINVGSGLLSHITRTFSAPNQSFSIHSSHHAVCSQMWFAPFSWFVFGVFSQPLWSFTCSQHFHVLAASSAPHTPVCVCRRTPLRSMLLCFVFFVVIFCALRQWRRGNIALIALLPMPDCLYLFATSASQRTRLPLTKNIILRNFNDSNTSQLSQHHGTCTILPSQPSPCCCGEVTCQSHLAQLLCVKETLQELTARRMRKRAQQDVLHIVTTFLKRAKTSGFTIHSSRKVPSRIALCIPVLLLGQLTGSSDQRSNLRWDLV